MLALYTTVVSSNARKVLAAAIALELKAEIHDVNVYQGEGRTPEYLAINPFGKVPTLVDGDFVLFESNAILQYLSEAHGQNRLWASDAKGRADVARWLFWESAHWQPAWTTVMTPFVGHGVRPDLFPKPDEDPDWDDVVLAKDLAFLDGHLEGRSWLVDERLTLADLSVAAMMTYARICHFPFDKYPSIAAWYGRVEALDAWKHTTCPLWEPKP